MLSTPITVSLAALDPADTRPPKIKIADRLRDAIRAGHYPIGKRIPGSAAIAYRYGVTTRTIQAATDLLVDDGVLHRQPKIGLFVKAIPDSDPAANPPTEGTAGQQP